jgi:hypothetical protein
MNTMAFDTIVRPVIEATSFGVAAGVAKFAALRVAESVGRRTLATCEARDPERHGIDRRHPPADAAADAFLARISLTQIETPPATHRDELGRAALVARQ